MIWLCDLRHSMALADSLPRQAFLDLLNEYLECMASAVMAHDGEVLKFIGDAMLAIFPLASAADDASPHENAVQSFNAIAAAREAIGRVEDLNQRRARRGEQPLGFGIALHLGDVMYGNVGAPGRLDFTVIGPTVNEVARLETMCKTLARPLVISGKLAAVSPEKLVSLGVHKVRDMRGAQELFTLPGLA